MRYIGLLLLATTLWARPAFADRPVLRIAVLKVGTVNWLTSTIVRQGLDRAAGYRLEVVGLAGGPATKIAFLSGDVDALVTDWVWAMGQRKRGRPLRFAPYSVALGALMSKRPLKLCDLAGRTIGVVGGKQDKSWITLQALARKRCRIELAGETRAVFGAPPLIARQLRAGAVDAVSIYWNWAAKIQASGGRRIIGINKAMIALGIDPPPPLIGFVWNEKRTAPGTIGAFLRSVAVAQEILRADDRAWETLRPLMRAGDDAEFRALRDHFRAGIPGPWTRARTGAARRLHALLLAGSGDAFRRNAGPFDPALFLVPGDDG